VQDLLFDPDANQKMFTLMLEQIAFLTESHYGCCVLADIAADTSVSNCSSTTSIHLKADRPFVNNEVLSNWIRSNKSFTRPSFFNTPYPKGCAELIQDGISTSALMILPIQIHHELRAIYILARKRGAYNSDVLQKLRPVIGAITCTMQSAESVTGNFLGLDSRIANKRYLSNLISSSPVGVLVIDSNGYIVMSNPTITHMLLGAIDSDPLLLKGEDIKSFFPNYERFFKWSSQRTKYADDIQTNGPRLWKQQTALGKNNEKRTVDLTIFRYFHGNECFVTLQVEDTTEYLSETERHQQTVQKLAALTQLLPVGIIQVDTYWNCIFANEKWFEFSGFDSNIDISHTWIDAIHPEDVEALLEGIKLSLETISDYHHKVRIVSTLGTTKWADFHSRVLLDEQHDVEGFIATFSDATESHIIQEKLRQVAQFDTLTGLANRMLLQDRLEQAFLNAQRDHSIVSIFFIDLDEFKNINDTLGHDVGDLLLQQVSTRLSNILRKSDTIARFGGDEFVVLLGKDDHFTEILVVAEKIIALLAEPFTIQSHRVYVTVSLGIAQGNHSDSNPETLLKNADLALYSAKKEGKNTYQIYNQEFEHDTVKRLNILNQLRSNSDMSRYILLYQPLCNTDDKSIRGFEALIRFLDDDGKLVPPDDFIPILEESGMILEVGKWVIKQTCRQLSLWQKQGVFPDNGYLSFNVSAKQLLKPGFIDDIKECCTHYKIEPKYLVMELTETVIINKPEKIRVILNEVREFGIRLALDDFGTGYSSLSYLQNYPFDILKIDKSFIDDLSENSKDTKITKAIVALASSMNLSVAAEGVENEFAYTAIKEIGIDLFQGYFVSKPISAEDAGLKLEDTLSDAGSRFDNDIIDDLN
jgi:diguanylate cyclase (GGDEF)-like protein/PAS domain S-box-containing protein